MVTVEATEEVVAYEWLHITAAATFPLTDLTATNLQPAPETFSHAMTHILILFL